MQITSLQNPKVKDALRLRERRDRDEAGSFLIEGYRELLRFKESGGVAETLFICPELFLGENEGALIDQLKNRGARVFDCTASVFHKLSYRDRPDGLIGVAKQKHLGLDQLILNENPFLIVAEAIEKPGNLGTILRSCDAAGVDGLILCDRCTDLFNPNVVRASVGTLFTVPVYEAKSEETLAWLKKNGVKIVAATPHAEVEFTKADFTGPVCVAIGTEQLGLSRQWMEGADIQVKIPMCGQADSLNAAMATVLMMYEVLRQRKC